MTGRPNVTTMGGVVELRTLAAANNAGWCSTVCRSHGLHTTFDADAWTSRTRTPPLYPDAVTLEPEVSVPELLARIDVSPGCSVKDSFDSLDLTAHGFRTLFEAEWFALAVADRPAASEPCWEVVHDSGTFAAWERGWRGDESRSDVLRVDLLDDDSIAVLAAAVDDEVVGGAILYRGSGVVGISNFFSRSPLGSSGWAGCLSFAVTVFPGSILVGYESRDELESARAQGLATVGPLRVWIYDG